MSAPHSVLDTSILVVDTVEADAHLFEAMLSGAGFTDVVTTSDPRAAAPLHGARRFGLVVLDLLPGMRGLEALAALFNVYETPPVPVIVVTPNPEDVERALHAGARDFISKPVRMAEFVARVRNLAELGCFTDEASLRGRLLAAALAASKVDLRQAESRFRVLVEQSIAGIYMAHNGRFTYANPRLCDWLGYGLEDLRRREAVDLIHPDDRPRFLDLRARRAAGGDGLFTSQFRFVQPRGGVVHLAFSGKAVEHQGRREILGVAQDVGEGVRAEAALQEANAKLRALSERVLASQEQERRYISRELHDDIGQSLLALNFGLHRLAGEREASGQGLLQECIDASAAIQERLRELSLELHPPHLDQLGLGDALSWLVRRQGVMTGIDIECRSGAGPAGRLSAATEGACYRICQEALSNATRHAVASHIVVSLACRAGRVELTVADDGIGFDRRGSTGTREQMGLTSMEERARLAGGDLELHTAPGAGTRVRASFPLHAG